MSLLDEFRHKPIEKCQHQRRNMCTVHVGIRHDNNLAITQLCDIKILVNPCAKRGNHRLDLCIAIDLVKTCLLHIENLAAKR